MGEYRRVQDAAALLLSILVQCFLVRFFSLFGHSAILYMYLTSIASQLYRCHLLFPRKSVIGGLGLLLAAVVGALRKRMTPCSTLILTFVYVPIDRSWGIQHRAALRRFGA